MRLILAVFGIAVVLIVVWVFFVLRAMKDRT